MSETSKEVFSRELQVLLYEYDALLLHVHVYSIILHVRLQLHFQNLELDYFGSFFQGLYATYKVQK